MLNERAGELSGNPVVSARFEKEGVSEGIGNFRVGQNRRARCYLGTGMNKSRGSKVNGGPDQPLCSAHCGDEIYGSGLPKPRTPHVDWLSAMKRCDKGRRQTALWDKRLQERGGQWWTMFIVHTRDTRLSARWQGGRHGNMLKSTWNTAFQLPESAAAMTKGCQGACCRASGKGYWHIWDVGISLGVSAQDVLAQLFTSMLS